MRLKSKLFFKCCLNKMSMTWNDWHTAKNSCKTIMHETYKLSDLLNHVSFVLYMPSDAFLLYILSLFHAPVYPFNSRALRTSHFNLNLRITFFMFPRVLCLYIPLCVTFLWCLKWYTCLLFIIVAFLIYFILTMNKYIRILPQFTSRLGKLKTVHFF